MYVRKIHSALAMAVRQCVSVFLKYVKMQNVQTNHRKTHPIPPKTLPPLAPLRRTKPLR